MKTVEGVDKICSPAAAGLIGGVTYIFMETAPNLRIGNREYPTSLVIAAIGVGVLVFICATHK